MLLQLSYNKNEMVYNRSSLLKILENLKKISKEFFQKKIILIFSFSFYYFYISFSLTSSLSSSSPVHSHANTFPTSTFPFLLFYFFSLSFLFIFPFSFLLFSLSYPPPPPPLFLSSSSPARSYGSLSLSLFLPSSFSFLPLPQVTMVEKLYLAFLCSPSPPQSYKTHVIFGSLCVFSNHRGATAVQLIFSGILRFKRNPLNCYQRHFSLDCLTSPV